MSIGTKSGMKFVVELILKSKPEIAVKYIIFYVATTKMLIVDIYEIYTVLKNGLRASLFRVSQNFA